MKKLICLFALIMLLSGCATSDPTYYTRLDSPGYNEKVLKGLCEKCKKDVYVSHKEYDQDTKMKYCYCGHIQSAKSAYNLAQQQERLNNLTPREKLKINYDSGQIDSNTYYLLLSQIDTQELIAQQNRIAEQQLYYQEEAKQQEKNKQLDAQFNQLLRSIKR